MYKRQTIAVVFGGASSEHEISCISASNIIKNLDPQRYEIVCVGIQKNGSFFLYTGDPQAIADGSWRSSSDCIPCTISPSRTDGGILVFESTGVRSIRVDCVIPVLHGKNGEDGTIQGLFELAQIPYVGCSVLCSSTCLDKQITHILLEHAGIPMANWMGLRKHDVPSNIEKQVAKHLGYPVFVKPANAGSSIGVSRVNDASALQEALTLAFAQDDKILIEEMIVGQEVECAMLGSPIDVSASLPGEIDPAHDFYDYEAKYHSTRSLLYVPARVSQDVQHKLQQIAQQAFDVMNCSGLARVDFFVTREQRIVLNEINTFPGFTDISMYPMLWNSMGLPTTKLLDRLIAYAIERSNNSNDV